MKEETKNPFQSQRMKDETMRPCQSQRMMMRMKEETWRPYQSQKMMMRIKEVTKRFLIKEDEGGDNVKQWLAVLFKEVTISPN